MTQMTDSPRGTKPRTRTPKVDGRIVLGVRNRQALLKAADELFRTKGYAAVSIREIIAKAQVGLGTFYNHFKDKEEVLRIVLNERRTDTLVEQHNLRARGATFSEFIHAHFLFFFEVVFEQPVYLELLGPDAALFQRVISQPPYLKAIDTLKKDLDDAMRRGLLGRTDTECLTAAIMGIALEVGRVMVRRPNPDPAEATRFAAQLVLGGVSPPPAPPTGAD